MSDRKKSNSADKKLNESLKNLSARQRSEALAAQKEQRKWKLYGVLTVIVILLIAALLFWDHGFIQQRATALTIGEKNYTAADLDYYYYSQYNMMYSYASYYGIDTSVSLKEQEAYDGTTWYDYLMNSATSSLTEVSILAQEGEKAGYTISDEGQQSIDDVMSNLEDTAKENNVSKAYYLHRMYGRYMTEKRFKQIVTEYYYAYDYQTAKTDGFEISDDDINTYYDENKDTLDTYEFVCYGVDATPDAKQDEDGNDIALTAADYAEAEQVASDNAEKLKAALESGETDTAARLAENMTNVTDYSSTTPDSFGSYTFGEWLQDSSRKANDVTTLTDTTTVSLSSDSDDPADGGDSSAESSAVDSADSSSADSSAASDDSTEEQEVTSTIYVVQFLKRYRDDYYAGTLRSILVSAEQDEDGNYDYDSAKTAADGLLATFEANGGTEDAFIALGSDDEEDAEEADSTDTADASGSAASDAEEAPSYTVNLYESEKKGAMSTALDDWLYGSDHQTGDTAVLKDEDSLGYDVVYFVGYDHIYQWQSTAKSALQSDAYDDWYSEVSEDYESTQTWFYSQVG